MFESTERRGFPGGLRAQFLLGLLLLVVGTMALVALIGVHLARQQVEQSQLERAAQTARRLADLRQFLSADEIMKISDSNDADYTRLRVGSRLRTRGELPNGTEFPRTDDLLADHADRPAVAIARLGGRPFAIAATTAGRGDSRWQITVARSLDDAYARLDQSRHLLLAYLGIDALFILIVGYAFLTYVVVRPIRAIGTATERAARGDLASHVEILPPNEFGRVGRSFNRMLDKLHDNRRELEQRVEQLDAANRELEQTQESLIRSEKMASVGQLAAGVAHEIGNPLSAISGYLDLVDDPDLDQQRREDVVGRMNRQVDRIQTIIRDLLDYSRDQSDREIEPVALERCVDEAVDLLAPQPSAREVEIAVDLPDDLPEVRANRDQLVQVCVNLLMNAADAIDQCADHVPESEGRIEVTAATTAESVELTIADNGPGIPDEKSQRIFDPFYTTKDPGEGTGLGLAITLRIMDRFGGEITVDSTPGEGAAFTLIFQKAEFDAGKAAGPPTEQT